MNALQKLDGVVTKLDSGAKVADIGCGGVALIEFAKQYRRSQFHGYDISTCALARAEANKAQAGVGNLIFHDARTEPLSGDASFDFIATFDCIHDTAHPQDVISAIRKALKPDGTWLIADIHGQDTFEKNLTDNPLASLLYGFSVLCCMSSAMSEPGGAGLGTLGFPESYRTQNDSRGRVHAFQKPRFQQSDQRILRGTALNPGGQSCHQSFATYAACHSKARHILSEEQNNGKGGYLI